MIAAAATRANARPHPEVSPLKSLGAPRGPPPGRCSMRTSSAPADADRASAEVRLHVRSPEPAGIRDEEGRGHEGRRGQPHQPEQHRRGVEPRRDRVALPVARRNPAGGDAPDRRRQEEGGHHRGDAEDEAQAAPADGYRASACGWRTRHHAAPARAPRRRARSTWSTSPPRRRAGSRSRSPPARTPARGCSPPTPGPARSRRSPAAGRPVLATGQQVPDARHRSRLPRRRLYAAISSSSTIATRSVVIMAPPVSRGWPRRWAGNPPGPRAAVASSASSCRQRIFIRSRTPRNAQATRAYTTTTTANDVQMGPALMCVTASDTRICS